VKFSGVYVTAKFLKSGRGSREKFDDSFVKEYVRLCAKDFFENLKENASKIEDTGTFKKSIKMKEIGEAKYVVYSDAHNELSPDNFPYPVVIEHGHQKEYFVPFSYSGGELTAFGEWALRHGWKKTDKVRKDGRATFRWEKHLATGIVIRARGKFPFRRAWLKAKARFNKNLYKALLRAW